MELPTSHEQLKDTRRKISKIFCIRKFYLNLFFLICSFTLLGKFYHYCLLYFIILFNIFRFVHINLSVSFSLIYVTLRLKATFIQKNFIFINYNSFSHDSFKKIAYCTELMVQYKCVATLTVLSEQ